jgi:hypothetical protein
MKALSLKNLASWIFWTIAFVAVLAVPLVARGYSASAALEPSIVVAAILNAILLVAWIVKSMRSQ